MILTVNQKIENCYSYPISKFIELLSKAIKESPCLTFEFLVGFYLQNLEWAEVRKIANNNGWEIEQVIIQGVNFCSVQPLEV